MSGKIHTGRSRNEQVSLDVRLWLRASSAIRCCGSLRELMTELLDLAEKYPDAVIPGYTHLRRAQAVLWPHYLLAYFEMFARDFERLQQAKARINVLPLGSGALAGSGFPFDREAIAKDLGFAAITRNSLDVSGDRDFALDFLYACSTIMLHLSRLAEDWILYSSEEFGWMALGDGVTSGSSLMPQKKNPDSLELIRGKSRPRLRRLHFAVRHDEGSSHDLQPRHAGRQGAAVRRLPIRPRDRSRWRKVVAESVTLDPARAAGRGRRKLGGGNGSGGGTGAQRRSLSSRPSACRAAGAGEYQKAARSRPVGPPKN